MPAISIIVPVYNTEKYLHRCLDSILAQTFTDWECILVDDGSPDNSGMICDEYAAMDSRFKVIHKENGGVAAARNTAVDQANGKFVTFVDSDDWLHPLFLSVLYDGIKQHNGDICVSYALPTTVEDTPGRISAEYVAMNTREAMNRYGKSGTSVFRGPMAKLVKTEIAKKCPFPEGRKIAEDLATNYRYYDAADIIVGNESQLYFYYINNDSVTNQTYNIGRVKGLDTLEELMAYFKANDYPELYDHYKAEYCYDLFKQYANIHKHLNEPAIERDLLTKLQNITGLHIPDNIFFAEDLISFIEKNGRNDLLNIFVFGFAHDLYRNLDNTLTATKGNALTWDSEKQLKQLLKEYAKKCDITVNKHPEWFNAAFPNEMKLYWIYKGIIHKLKG